MVVISLLLARSASANLPHDPAVNVPVSTAGWDQQMTFSCPDGNGGAIVVWTDDRDSLTNGYDVYAQHVFGSGLVDPFWAADGVPICTLPGDQFVYGGIVPDGSGGAIIAWNDQRAGFDTAIYAQHLQASGTLDPAWPVNGRLLSETTGQHSVASICSDGAGGAIACWRGNPGYNPGFNDIYAQHVLASGAVDNAWPASGLAVCTAAGTQYDPQAVADGSGGAVIAWTDKRNGVDTDIYAQHVLSSGGVDPGWTVDGVSLTTAAGDDAFNFAESNIVTDDTGGAIVVWVHTALNHDVYTQRIMSSGAVDPAWPANGRLVCAAPGNQDGPAVVSDGYGGAIVAWGDQRVGGRRVYAQHVLVAGVLDPGWPFNGKGLSAVGGMGGGHVNAAADGSGGAIVTWAGAGVGSDILVQRVDITGAIPLSWPANGRVVCSATGDQDFPAIASDGGGRAIVAWEDLRNGNYDIYAQRVDGSSFLGNPNPHILAIQDVPHDQGGLVELAFEPSYLDDEAPALVDHYWVLRERQTLSGGSIWERLERIEARHLPDPYGFAVPTLADSSASGTPFTRFMVTAYDPEETLALPSDPDSGYSVDDLAPQVPGHFAGDELSSGGRQLHWNPNPEPDLSHYRVYKGPTASFTPGPGNLIGEPTDTTLFDASPPVSFYKLSAVDIHDNESPYALLAPPGTGVAGGGPAVPFELHPPNPNPARSGTQIGFGLPVAGRVRVTIYDVAGRRLRTLVEGVLEAGEHSRAWDLRDGSGRAVAAGLYFVRLEAEGKSLTHRLAVASR